MGHGSQDPTPASPELVEDMGMGPPKAPGDTCSPRLSPEGPGGHLLSPSIPRRPWGTPALPVCPPKALGDTCCPRPSPEGPGGHLLSPSVPRRPWGTPALPVRPLLLWPMMRDLRQVLGASAPVSLLESLVSCVLGLLHRFCPARITDLQSDQRN